MISCHERVKSIIVDSDNFIEYRYKSLGENFIGLWKKVGTQFVDNPSTSSFKCGDCVSHSDTWIRRRGIAKPVSYQCVGHTQKFNQYDWNIG